MKQFVRDLKVGDTVESEFLVTEKVLVNFSQPNRSGEQFLRLQFADVSGTIKAVVWENGAAMAGKFRIGDVVRVRGDVGEYKGLQLVVYSLEALDRGKVDRRLFQRAALRSSDEMLAELADVRAAVLDPYLAALLGEFFGDEKFLTCYSLAPAAKNIHHNYSGGLLEHSLEVAVLCRRLTSLYPQLQASLLYCGALLHDVGKIMEYDADSLNFELTTPGKLLGHIAIGKEMVDERTKKVPGFPENLRLELAHLLLSHHGQKEWGSPEVPKTFEAFALFHADLISARLNQFSLVMSKGGEGGWTEWDRHLERSIFLG